MSETVQRTYTKRQRQQEEVQASSLPSALTDEEKAALKAETDALLDDIEEVLEENATDFVRAYVQKGGQ